MEPAEGDELIQGHHSLDQRLPFDCRLSLRCEDGANHFNQFGDILMSGPDMAPEQVEVYSQKHKVLHGQKLGLLDPGEWTPESLFWSSRWIEIGQSPREEGFLLE